MRRLRRVYLPILTVILVSLLWAGLVMAAEKLPAPPADRQAAALKLVRDAYRIDSATTAAARKALAEKMLKEAGDTGDADARFVLLNESTRLAAAAGDLSGAARSIDALGEAFTINPWTLRIVSLRTASDAVQSPKDAALVASSALAILDAAIAAGNYRASDEIIPIAERLAAKAADKSAQASIRQRQTQVRELRASETKVAAARKTLATDPANAEANLVLGRFDCLVRGDWAHGLPSLAQGSDAALAALAKRDLDTPAEADAGGMKRVGDGWWTAASAQTGLAKTQMQRRAAHWYDGAMDGLKGLDRTLVEKRLAEAANSGNTASRVIDLLKLVGGRAKADWGTWSMETEGLVCTKSGRVLLPYVPPEEYDLRVVFTRISGTDSLAVFCPLAKGTLLCVANGSANTAIHFANLTGRNDWHFMTKDEKKEKFLNDTPYTWTIRVRKAGVQAALNTQVEEMATDGTGFRNEALQMNGEAVLALHTQGTANFSTIEITEITGRGHVVKEKE